jgi:hypothetical protein
MKVPTATAFADHLVHLRAVQRDVETTFDLLGYPIRVVLSVHESIAGEHDDLLIEASPAIPSSIPRQNGVR